jgi:hypothetical protein
MRNEKDLLIVTEAQDNEASPMCCLDNKAVKSQAQDVENLGMMPIHNEIGKLVSLRSIRFQT